MMQSILSLINETLTTKPTAVPESASKLKTTTTRGEFETHLTREEPGSMRCASATRIKARAPSSEENGVDDDDEDATTCVNVDDFAAWALPMTIAAPPPAMNAAMSMTAAKMSAAPQPLPAMDRASETIPAAALAPQTQEFASPFAMTRSQEMVAQLGVAKTQEMESPLSSAITREFGSPVTKKTAATVAQMNSEAQQTSVAQQNAATQQDAAFAEKMARSANATEIPPPADLPMVNSTAPAPTLADEAHDRLKSTMAAATSWAPTSTRPSGIRGPLPIKFTRAAKLVDLKNANSSTSSAPISAAVAAAAGATLRPTTFMLEGDSDVASPMVPDLRPTAEARQEAATNAVNQMTLRRAADGELDIPELGRVRINAQSNAGEVNVRISADRPETQALVAGHTDAMILDAKTAAITISEIRVIGDSKSETHASFSSSQDAPRGRQQNSKNSNGDESTSNEGVSSLSSNRARFVL